MNITNTDKNYEGIGIGANISVHTNFRSYRSTDSKVIMGTYGQHGNLVSLFRTVTLSLATSFRRHGKHRNSTVT